MRQPAPEAPQLPHLLSGQGDPWTHRKNGHSAGERSPAGARCVTLVADSAAILTLLRSVLPFSPTPGSGADAGISGHINLLDSSIERAEWQIDPSRAWGGTGDLRQATYSGAPVTDVDAAAPATGSASANRRAEGWPQDPSALDQKEEKRNCYSHGRLSPICWP